MYENVTKREKDILNFINCYISIHGYAPTVREIAAGIGLYSHYTVQRHLEHLREKGYINYLNKTIRTITLSQNAKDLLL